MTRTDAQQLVRDAAWRLSSPERVARLSPDDFKTLGMAIHGLLGWGGMKASKDRDAREIRAIIAKMEAPSLAGV